MKVKKGKLKSKQSKSTKSLTESTVEVKHASPLWVVTYNTLQKFQMITYVTIALTFIYCIFLVIKAIDIGLHYSYFVNMVTDDEGTFLPIILFFPVLPAIILNFITLYLIRKAFRPHSQKGLNSLMFLIVCLHLVLLALLTIFIVLILLHIYESSDYLHDGIKTAMKSYSTNFEVKKEIDLMQMHFQCCGSKHYTEWYNIQWYDPSFVKKEEDEYSGETPFSCCSFASVSQCIHHGIETISEESPYNYNKRDNFSVSAKGCYPAVISYKRKLGWLCISFLLLLIKFQFLITCMLRFIQTAHRERMVIDLFRLHYTVWLIGCYQGSKTSPKTPPPIPPVPKEFLEVSN